MSHLTDIAKAAWHAFIAMEKQLAAPKIPRPAWDKLSATVQTQMETVIQYIHSTNRENYQISKTLGHLKNIGVCFPAPSKVEAHMLALCVWEIKCKSEKKLSEPRKPLLKSYMCSAPISQKDITARNLQDLLTALTQTAKIYKHLQTATDPTLIQLFHERLVVLEEDVDEVDLWIAQSNQLKPGSEQEKNIFNMKLDILQQHILYLKKEVKHCHKDLKHASLSATTHAEADFLRTQLKPFWDRYTWINAELHFIVERQNLLRLSARAVHPYLQMITKNYQQLGLSIHALMLSLAEISKAAKLHKTYDNLLKKAKAALHHFNVIATASTHDQILELLKNPDHNVFNRVVATQEKINHFEFKWGHAIKSNGTVATAYSEMMKKIGRGMRLFSSEAVTTSQEIAPASHVPRFASNLRKIR